MLLSINKLLHKARIRTLIPMVVFLLAVVTGLTIGSFRYSAWHNVYRWFIFLPFLLHFTALILSLFQAVMILGERKENRLSLFPWLFISLAPAIIYLSVFILIMTRV